MNFLSDDAIAYVQRLHKTTTSGHILDKVLSTYVCLMEQSYVLIFIPCSLFICLCTPPLSGGSLNDATFRRPVPVKQLTAGAPKFQYLSQADCRSRWPRVKNWYIIFLDMVILVTS